MRIEQNKKGKIIGLYMRRSDGSLFSLKKYNGKWNIKKHETFYITDAYINDDVLMWNKIEPFESMVQGFLFLKENIENLL